MRSGDVSDVPVSRLENQVSLQSIRWSCTRRQTHAVVVHIFVMGKAAGVSRRRRKVAQTKFKRKSTLKKQRTRQLRESKPSE